MKPLGRRHFVTTAAMSIAAARMGSLTMMEANAVASRELTALGRATEWLNSPRLTPADLLGKVVVVNFCTYTCINWLRTLPYLRAWSRKYQERFALIGVHTPEFAFERNLQNVRRSIEQMKIDYPIVIDNDYAIWRTFNNQYWPALYFMDARGRVREHHFGEGEYQRSETIIQRLLGEGRLKPATTTDKPATTSGFVSVEGQGIEAAADWNNLKSPENYLGYDRTQNFSSRGGAELDRRRAYIAPARLTVNQWALSGEWTIGRQAAVSNGANGRIACRFHARDLHLVMGPSRPETPVRFRVAIDSQPPGPARGGDVDADGTGTVVEQRLYQLIRQPKPIVDRQFEIEFLDPGVEALAFTFG